LLYIPRAVYFLIQIPRKFQWPFLNNLELPGYSKQALELAKRLEVLKSRNTNSKNLQWLSTDNLMSRVSSTVYQRFAGGGYLSGIKVVRGYSEPGKQKNSEKGPSTPTSAAAKPSIVPGLQLDEQQQRILKRRSAPPLSSAHPEDPQIKAVRESAEATVSLLQDGIDPETEAEAVRKRDEAEMQNDYNDADADQGREISHLILVTHGIGQRLGMR